MEEPWHEEGMLARELAQCPRQVDSGPGELVEGTGWKKQIHDKGRWLGSGDCHHNGGGGSKAVLWRCANGDMAQADEV